MKRGLFLITALAASLLAGCEGSDKTTTAPVPIADADLVVSEDFADEAEKSITTANYKSELDALEKEIDAPAQ